MDPDPILLRRACNPSLRRESRSTSPHPKNYLAGNCDPSLRQGARESAHVGVGSICSAAVVENVDQEGRAGAAQRCPGAKILRQVPQGDEEVQVWPQALRNPFSPAR